MKPVLELFRRPRPQNPAGPEGPGDATHRSHVFPKFLKRLSLIERPTVLDLGRLSGGNIEIFARLGCRVQVEDLVMAADERAAGAAHAAAGVAPMATGDDAPAGTTPAAAGPVATAAAPDAAGADATPRGTTNRGTTPEGAAPPGAGAPAAGGPGSELPPGTRPSRRIVLPPRHVGRTTPAPGAAGTTRTAARPEPTPLSAGFSYADGAFDAILAWDLVNYYDPQSARRLAGEIGRILRPGGLVYGWLHSRSAPGPGPDGPRRFRILDEARLVEEPFAGRPLHRHLYQNRDIEKMFADLRIAEMYFLKSGIREMLLEKRAPGSAPPPATPAARPRPRFRIE